MKKDFKFISTLLIVLLTVLLVVILVSYYNKPFVINTDVIDNKLPIANHDDRIENISGDKDDLTSGENLINSTDDPLEGSSGENSTNIILPPNKPKNEDKTVIITSDDTMTNKEKRQILTELDTTLMELLEAVDKVQTVDETRLVNKDESGVQE